PTLRPPLAELLQRPLRFATGSSCGIAASSRLPQCHFPKARQNDNTKVHATSRVVNLATDCDRYPGNELTDAHSVQPGKHADALCWGKHADSATVLPLGYALRYTPAGASPLIRGPFFLHQWVHQHHRSPCSQRSLRATPPAGASTPQGYQ
ncbi:unnamed protein product, partial [Ectocarpus sp. 12 AP-2014]